MPVTDIEKFIRDKQKSVLGSDVIDRPLEDAPRIEIDIVKGPGVEDMVTPSTTGSLSFADKVRQKTKPSFAERVKKEADRGFIRDYSRAFNGIIADALDLPGAAFAGILNMLPLKEEGVDPIKSGGWRQLFVDAGLTDPKDAVPDTAASAIGRFVAETMLLLPFAPMGAGVKGVRAAEMGFGQGTKAMVKGAGESLIHPVSKGVPNIKAAGESIGAGAKRLAKNIGDTAVKHPKTFAGIELASGASAGFFGFAAKENFPNNELAEFWGNLVGGMAPALTPTGLAVRALRGGAEKFRFFKSEKGAEQRMSKRLQESVMDKDLAVDELKGSNTLPGAELTPAQQSGDPLLLALEKAIIDSNTKFAVRSDEQLAELNATIINSLRAKPKSAEITRDALDETRKYINSLVEGRLRIAMHNIKERLQKLEPTASREQANEIAREEIESALTVARTQEDEIWGMVPLDVEAQPSALMATWRKHLEEFNASRTADPESLPTDLTFGPGKMNLKELLGDFRKTKGRRLTEGAVFEDNPVRFIGGILKDGTNVRELQQMRSKILRAIRDEGGKIAPNFNRIRILDDLQEAILSDLGAAKSGATSEAGALLQQALDFSADLNKRFTKGPVGRILGMDKTGTTRTPSGLTLEKSIGGGGPNAKENFDRIMDAVKDNPENMKGAVENYIKARFVQEAVKNDSINISKAESFLKRNKQVLDQFPEIQFDIEMAIREENIRLIRERKVKTIGSRLNNPRISKAALYIQKDPEQAFQEIAKSRNPAGELAQLVKMAGRDISGEAFKGLQESFIDWVLQRSMINSVDARRQKFVSGFLMDRVMQDPPTKMMADTLLSAQQKERINQAIETAVKMEKALSAKAAVEGIIDDVPHRVLNDIMGIAGAQVGRVTARSTGGGTVQTPGIFARRARDLFKEFSKDNAEQLLIDAFMADKNDQLLEALLREIKTEADLEFVRKQLNAWLAVTAYEAGAKLPGTTDDSSQ